MLHQRCAARLLPDNCRVRILVTTNFRCTTCVVISAAWGVVQWVGPWALGAGPGLPCFALPAGRQSASAGASHWARFPPAAAGPGSTHQWHPGGGAAAGGRLWRVRWLCSGRSVWRGGAAAAALHTGAHRRHCCLRCQSAACCSEFGCWPHWQRSRMPKVWLHGGIHLASSELACDFRQPVWPADSMRG